MGDSQAAQNAFGAVQRVNQFQAGPGGAAVDPSILSRGSAYSGSQHSAQHRVPGARANGPGSMNGPMPINRGLPFNAMANPNQAMALQGVGPAFHQQQLVNQPFV